MNITGAKIDPMEGYANDPRLIVDVDTLAGRGSSEIVHRVIREDRGSHTYYFANEKDGYVHYLAHDPNNTRGFGGATFKVLTPQGLIAVKGPWSSRSSFMNMLFVPHSFEAVLCPADNGCKIAGALTVEVVRDTLEKFCPEWTLMADHSGGEVGYKLIQEG